MPTYDYLCTTCGKRFDVVQSMKDDALTHCPVDLCDQPIKGQGAIQRVISGGSGVIYKGEGFYLTDYTKKSGTSDAPASTAPAKDIPSKETPAANPAPPSKPSQPSSPD